jgi:hypothetical protein
VDTDSSQNDHVSISFSVIKIVSRKTEIKSINGGGNSGSIFEPLSIFTENSIIIFSKDLSIFIRFLVSENRKGEGRLSSFLGGNIWISLGINQSFGCNSEPTFENDGRDILLNLHSVGRMGSMSMLDSKLGV